MRIEEHPQHGGDVAHFGSVDRVQSTDNERNASLRQLRNQLFAMPVVAVKNSEARLGGMCRLFFPECFNPRRHLVCFGISSLSDQGEHRQCLSFTLAVAD